MALLRTPIACIMYLTDRCDGYCWYCTVRSTVRNRFAHGTDADHAKVAKRIVEFKELGGRFIELTGGNPLLMDWLPEILTLCNERELLSSLSLCGPQIVKRLSDWGEEWIKLPSIIRFSVDGDELRQDHIRGGGFHESVRVGLEVAKRVRPKGTTQLALILVPGNNGNINRDQLSSVLELSERFSAVVNLYPLFGTAFSRTKERSDGLWKSITDKEIGDLYWLLDQPGVMEQSRGKVDFLLSGGNKIQKPSCLAGRTVISIGPNDRLSPPCDHNPNAVPIGKRKMKDALYSAAYNEIAVRSGRLHGCDSCTVWCNDVKGELWQNPYMLDYIYDGM